MALGATRSDVLWMVLRMGFRLIGIGLAVGLLASFGVTRVIANQLWGISPHDPYTIIGVIGILVTAGPGGLLRPSAKGYSG